MRPMLWMPWRRFVLGLGMVLSFAALAQNAQNVSAPVTLAQMRDRLRPLLIFAPVPNDPRLLDEVRMVTEHAAEAADRDLVPVAVVERGDAAASHRLADGDIAEARRRFHVGSGEFAVVLVGKDGGEKLRAGKPIPFARLRETIDAMPMRRDEMKARQ